MGRDRGMMRFSKHSLSTHLKLPVPEDFSFIETLQAHGWPRFLPFSWDENTGVLERVEQVSDGRIVRITLQEEEKGCVAVEVSDTADPEEITRNVRRMLQLDLPVDAFHTFCTARPELAHVPQRRQGRMLRSPTLWEDTVKVILTTNTTWSQTKGMVSRFTTQFGAPCPDDPSRHAFPPPEQIAAIPPDDFADRAKFGYRSPAVHKLAGEITSGVMDLEALQSAEIPAPDLWKRLLALRGVGPYAASCLMIYLGRYERVNVDSWARMMVSKELGRPVTDKEVHTFFEPYDEWKALVYHFYRWKHEEPAY